MYVGSTLLDETNRSFVCKLGSKSALLVMPCILIGVFVRGKQIYVSVVIDSNNTLHWEIRNSYVCLTVMFLLN